MKQSNLKKLTAKNSKWITNDPSGIHFLDVWSYHSLSQAVGYLKYTHNKEGDVLFRAQHRLYPTLFPSLFRGVKSSGGMQKRSGALTSYINACRKKGDVLQVTPEYSHEPLLQHYGIRTRWIDLVDNIWVALWFGCYDFVLNGRQHQQAHFQVRSSDEYFFILLLLTGTRKEDEQEPGYYENETVVSIDLRKACPSVFLRPHSQHGILARKKRIEKLSDADMMDTVVGIVRISVGDAMQWLGSGDLLSARNLFPPPHYDYGYGILLQNALQGNETLGSITYFFP